jgi:rubrerythrin
LTCGSGDGVRSSRRSLLGRALALGALAGSGGAVAAAWPEAAGSAPSAALDAKIFNFALALEHVQAGFYTKAADTLTGELREFAEIVGSHERAHVDFLERALGAKATPKPALAFGAATKNPRKFLAAAVLLENLGVAAYNGQVANLTKASVAKAAEIVSAEARHAAWISDIAGRPPAPRAADPGMSAAEVAKALKSTGFVR